MSRGKSNRAARRALNQGRKRIAQLYHLAFAKKIYADRHKNRRTEATIREEVKKYADQLTEEEIQNYKNTFDED